MVRPDAYGSTTGATVGVVTVFGNQTDNVSNNGTNLTTTIN